MTAVIYHNPNCGTSRNTLKMIEASGEDIHVVEYLETGWTRPQLLALFAGASLTPRQALRVSKSPAEELGLTDPSVSDEALLEAMLEHPILVNRPIVVTPKGIRLCRPSEVVLELLENPHFGVFTKEDGEQIDTERT
ncbi:MAG: arsenate reductase (glutaredoxin) [Pseudomonadota bacterium]